MLWEALALGFVVGIVTACDFPVPSAIRTTVDAASDALEPPTLGPSCQGLPAACGSSGTANCCDPGNPVVGGTYYRSYDLAGDGLSGSRNYPATISTFFLDKYEVTVGRFRTFVNAGRGTQASAPAIGEGAHDKIAGSGWDTSWNASLPASQSALVAAVKCQANYTWTDIPGANEARPMNCLTWYEAMAFCIWDGGYLPTEAEWNYAATGGGQQRAYPWSVPAETLTLTAAHASYKDGANCVGDGVVGCAVTDLVRVGSKPMGDGLWGQSDLAGNVWEWSLDRYASQYSNPCTDCAQMETGEYRVFRGGTYGYGEITLRTGDRRSGPAVLNDDGVGVRCARRPRGQ